MLGRMVVPRARRAQCPACCRVIDADRRRHGTSFPMRMGAPAESKWLSSVFLFLSCPRRVAPPSNKAGTKRDGAFYGDIILHDLYLAHIDFAAHYSRIRVTPSIGVVRGDPVERWKRSRAEGSQIDELSGSGSTSPRARCRGMWAIAHVELLPSLRHRTTNWTLHARQAAPEVGWSPGTLPLPSGQPDTLRPHVLRATPNPNGGLSHEILPTRTVPPNAART